MTDAEILDAAEDFRSQHTHGGTTFDEFDALNFARTIEAEVRKQDDALIRQMLEALEVTASDVCQVAHHKKRDRHGNGDACPVQARHEAAITAARARLEGKP